MALSLLNLTPRKLSQDEVDAILKRLSGGTAKTGRLPSYDVAEYDAYVAALDISVDPLNVDVGWYSTDVPEGAEDSVRTIKTRLETAAHKAGKDLEFQRQKSKDDRKMIFRCVTLDPAKLEAAKQKRKARSTRTSSSQNGGSDPGDESDSEQPTRRFRRAAAIATQATGGQFVPVA